MEYIDVLTEEGKPIGQSVPRSEVHAKGLWHQAVHVWIINSKGEILIQKRSAIKESSPGLWDISAAGHMSAGESVLEAVHKEISEELGIKISSDDLIEIGVVKRPVY
jgi:isopentenyldiphosphate isomerase